MVGVLPPPEAVVPEAPTIEIGVVPPPARSEIAGPEKPVSRVPSPPVVTRTVDVVAIVEAGFRVPVEVLGPVFGHVEALDLHPPIRVIHPSHMVSDD